MHGTDITFEIRDNTNGIKHQEKYNNNQESIDRGLPPK